MRTLILATVSAIALGLGGAGPLYAQNMNNAPPTNPAPAAEQTPSAGTMQPATPQAANPAQPSNPGMTSSSQDMANSGQEMGNTGLSHANWGRMSRADVKELQQKLQQEGLYRGRIDGIDGRETHAALRAYQHQNGLRVTGRPDQQTVASLLGGGTGVGSSMPSNNSNGTTNNGMNMGPGSNAGTSGTNNEAMPNTR